MQRKFLCLCGILLTLAAGPALAKDGKDGTVSGKPRPPVLLTGGMGFAWPFVVSVSGSVAVPLGRGAANSYGQFTGVPALRADVDLGLGGGMVSAGVSIPALAGTPTEDEIIVKGGVLRTWLFDAGPGKYRTYRGIITEMVAPGGVPATKFGLGYFRGSEPASRSKHFLYAFAGLSFS